MFTALPFLQVYCLNVTDSERYTVKCKCGPVAYPVLPESPTISPVEIDCPFWTLMLERSAYRVATPSCVPEAYNRTESNVFPNCCVMDIESSGHCSTPLFGVGICDESAMPS